MVSIRRVRGPIALAGLVLLASFGPGRRDAQAQNKAQVPPPALVPAPIAPALNALPAGRVAVSKDEGKRFTDDVTVPTDREARRLIQAAEDYIKKKEWRVACECLQGLLENREDSFLEIEGVNDQGKPTKVRTSVRTEANRLIGGLSADGLEFYQIQYGQAAEARLNDALAANDPAILAEVALRYLHTRAGAEATALLGTYHLDRGSYLMASLCFEKLLSRADADKLSVKLLLKAALALRRAGDTEGAEKIWSKLSIKAARGDLVLGTQKVTLEQLRKEYERSVNVLAQLGQRDSYVFRGNAARNAVGFGGTAFLEPRWTRPMLARDDSNADANKEDLDGTNWIRLNLDVAFKSLENKPVLPTFFPVAASGKLLYRTYDGVYCINLKDVETADGKVKAGEMLWNSRTEGSLHGMARTTERKATLEQWYSTFYRQPALGPVGVLFENALAGTLSHDSQRVYYVDDLAVPPHKSMLQSTAAFGGGVNVSFGPYQKEVHFSRLTAVDLDTGKLVWTIGERASGSDDKEKKASSSAAAELQDTYFLGPPLPLGGKLYTIVEKNTELRLVCIDPMKIDAQGSPEIAWMQSLGTANLRLNNDSPRRLQAAHLAYGDGILVCPTNAGVVLGIDLLSHSLTWAYSYRDDAPNASGDEVNAPVIINGRIRRGMAVAGGPAQERWRTSAPIVVGGKVVFTAHDAQHVHCVNLRNGQMLWTVKREDEDLYLAGVFGQKVVIVGKTYMRAVNLDEGARDSWGKPVWKLPTGGLPSGQGVASDDVYYLPLQKTGEGQNSGPGILAVNVTTGKRLTVAAKRNQELPGNLLFVDGDIISQTATAIAAYPQLRVKEEEISRRLKENPRDPIGLVERGEVYLYDGKLNEAVVDLRASLTFQPPAEARIKARNKLHEALTELFQEKFALAEPYLDEYRDLCKVDVPADADTITKHKLAEEQLRREANFLSLVGRGREGQGRLIDALSAYEQFGALTGNKELVGVVDEANTRTRPDVWSRGRIKGMIDRSSAEQRKQLEDAIADRYKVVRDRGVGELRKFVAVFGTHFQVGREAQLRLAEQLISDGSPEELNEAETKLQTLCFAPELRKNDPLIAARAIEAMIRIYVRRGLYEDAVSLYKQLGTEFKDVKVSNGKTGGELLQELLTDKRFLPYIEPHGLSWTAAFKAQDVSGNFHNSVSALTIEPEGDLLPFFRRHRLVLDINSQSGNAWSFRLLDRATNAELWKQGGLPVASYFINTAAVRFAHARGHMLVLHLNHMVSAYNLAERKPLWSYNLFGKNPLYANNPTTSIVNNNGTLSIAHQDGRQERLGGVAIVESSYVCLQTRDGLVAIDPSRPGPSILWTKSDVSLKADVFGDEHHLYIVEGVGNEGGRVVTRALRAQDGANVAVPEFASLYAKRVRILGRCLLLQEDEPSGGKCCRLYDVHTGEDVWRLSFSPRAIIVRSEDPKLTAVIERDHTVTLLNAHTGQVVFKSLIQGEHADKLQSASLISDGDRYYLALVRERESGLTWSPNVLFGIRSLPVNGPVYALNKTTGKLEWICDFLPHQNLLLEQVQDLPMMLFTSQFSKNGPGGAYERTAAKVTAIDKRTGKLLYDKEFAQSNPFHAVRADPQANSIELLRSDLKISFRPEGSVALAEPPPTRRSNVGSVIMQPALPVNAIRDR